MPFDIFNSFMKICPTERRVICQRYMQKAVHHSIICEKKKWYLNDHRSFWFINIADYFVSFYKMWQKY